MATAESFCNHVKAGMADKYSSNTTFSVKFLIMYALHVMRLLNKSISAKVKTVVSPLKNIKRFYEPKQPSSYSLKSQVKSDVVLFRHEKTNFYLLINVCSAIQCSFWTYLGVFLYRNIDKEVFNSNNAFWAKILEKEREYSYFLSGVVILFGWFCLGSTLFYSTRSVRKIILHKNGNHVTLVTYNLPGFNSMKVPLSSISAKQHRLKSKKYVPIKVKNIIFHYLINVEGEFSDPVLFDFTVGISRGI